MQSRSSETWVPRAAVAAVAIAAVTTVVMVKRAEHEADVALGSPAAQGPIAQASAPTAPMQDTPRVIKAPPLKPPPRDFARAPAQPRTDALGGPAACSQCGTVETVVALKGEGATEAAGYQMHIRMDDGSLQTVEQRGALPAGSRVRVDGGKVKALAAP